MDPDSVVMEYPAEYASSRAKQVGGSFYFACVCFSIFVYVVRPGEIVPILGSARLGLASFVLVALAFFACDGLRSVRDWAPAGAGLMKLFVLLGFLAIPLSIYRSNALEGWKGLVVNVALYFFWLPAVQNPARLRRLAVLLTLCGSSLTSCMFFFRLAASEGIRISVGKSYDPNDVAMVLAVIIPFAASLFFKGSFVAKLFWGPQIALIILAIFETGSRGGLIALGVACGLLVFAQRDAVKLWHKLAILLAATLFFMSPASNLVKERYQTVLSGEDYNLQTGDKGEAGRLKIWKYSAVLMAKHPLTGVGIGNSTTALGMEYGWWKVTHNAYLEVGLELGIAGLAVFLLLLRTIWRNCTQGSDVFAEQPDLQWLVSLAYCTRVALATYMVAGFFLSQAYSIMVPILLLLSNGLAHASRTIDDSHDGLNHREQQFVEGSQQG